MFSAFIYPLENSTLTFLSKNSIQKFENSSERWNYLGKLTKYLFSIQASPPAPTNRTCHLNGNHNEIPPRMTCHMCGRHMIIYTWHITTWSLFNKTYLDWRKRSMRVWQKKFIWPNGMVIPWFIQFQTRIIQNDLLIFRDGQNF